MSSNRITLAFLGLIFLVIVVLSSSRILNAIRSKTGLSSQKEVVKDANQSEEISVNSNSTFSGKETPATGADSLLYLLLGAGLFSGIVIKRIKG